MINSIKSLWKVQKYCTIRSIWLKVFLRLSINDNNACCVLAFSIADKNWSAYELTCLYRILSKIFGTLRRTLTGLQFLAREGSSFFNNGVKSASFKSFGNSALIKQLLNIFFGVSEQMVLEDFRSFWGMHLTWFPFLGLIRFRIDCRKCK